MREISGVVKSREAKVGAKGSFARVSVGGEFFNVFPHQDFYDIPQVGKSVKVMLEPQEGTNYWNVAGIKLMTPEEVATTPPATTGAPSGGNSREEAIMRQSCMKVASELVSAKVIAKETDSMRLGDLVPVVLEIEDKLYQGLLEQMAVPF